MSFRTKLFEFSKKRNSTARPDITQPGYYEGDIKDDFSPLSFTMTFNRGDVGNAQVPKYNYAYISDFGRYYYVTDWVFVKGLWRAAFTVDVLATYKDQILASRQFVTRAASVAARGIIDTSCVSVGGTVGDIPQTMIPSQFWGAGYENGTIVIGVIGDSGLNVGAVTYYAMGVGGYRNLMNALLDDISWANISVSEISEELQKALINPAQYIVSSIWLPKDAADFVVNSGAPSSDIVTDIKLGWWSFSIAAGGNVARILHSPISAYDYFTIEKYFSIATHPQNGGSTSEPSRPWLQLSPFSRYTFTCLPFGSFDLDTTELYGYSYLKVEIKVHAYTGDATMILSAAITETTPGKVFCIMNANCGVPLPVGQIALNITNMDSALTSAAIMGVTEIAQDMTSPTVVSGSYESKSKSKPSPHSTTTRKRG